MAADSDLLDWHTEYEISTPDAEYLVHYRCSTAKGIANNALIRTMSSTQAWIPETSYLTVNRPRDSAQYACFWQRQFREIVLQSFSITSGNSSKYYYPFSSSIFNGTLKSELLNPASLCSMMCEQILPF
jgi:hypothetical protein